MKKKEIIVVTILFIFIAILATIYFVSKKNSDKNIIKKSNVMIINKEILSISNKEINNCINGLIDYLNKEYYYECKRIEFYNNTFDKESNSTYFYALVIGADKSLIEITNKGDGEFAYSYVGNELTPDSISSVTGVSYTQIIEPDTYEKEKELEELREEGKKALPDDS